MDRWSFTEHGFWRRCWLATVLIALALTGLAAVLARFPGDLALAQAVQTWHSPVLVAGSDALRALGLPIVLTVTGSVIALALLRGGYRLEPAFVMLALLFRGWEVLLKEIAERPRPSPDLVHVLARHGSDSFPSGHVLGAVLFWGFLFFLATRHLADRRWRWTAQAITAGIVVLTGAQRVYSGAHWPSDVMGGYLWGAILLAVLIWTYERFRRAPAGARYQPG